MTERDRPRISYLDKRRQREQSGPRRRSALLAVVAAALVVSTVAVGGVRAWQGYQQSSCEAMPITLEAPARAPTPEIAPQDVLVAERSSNAMSDWDGPVVVVSDTGDVVALERWFGGRAYRRARVTAETLERLRRCVRSEAFQNMQLERSSAQATRTCAVADASTVTIAAGPAAGSTKSVAAYGLGVEYCKDFPPALLDLNRALGDLTRQVATRGVPTGVPADELIPS